MDKITLPMGSVLSSGKTVLSRNMFAKVQTNYVAKIVEKFEDASLLNGNKKQKAKFSLLSKEEKRAWREALQRAIAATRNRNVARVLSGVKPRGKTSHRLGRLSSLEEQLIENMREGVTFQTGVPDVVQTTASVAATLAVSAAAVYTASGTKTLVDTVTRAARRFEDGVHRTATAVERAASNVENVTGKTDSLLSTFTDAFASFVEKIKEYGAMYWKPAVIALIMWILTRYAHVNVLVAAVLSLATVFVPECLELLKKYAPRGLHFQNGHLSLTADIITMILTCWVPGKDVKTMSGEFMRRVSNFTRATEGVESFISKVVDLCEQLLNFVLSRKDGNRISFKDKKNAYEEWKVLVIDFLSGMAKDTKPPIEFIREGKQLQLTGFGFHQVLATNESKRDLAFWMEKLSLALAPHEGALACENNLRPMPYCIMIGGASGVGKTTLVRMIGATILMLAKECTPSNALENLWQKGTTEYWNGYIGQKCLVLDDCFQVRGKPGDMDSEAMQLIRAIGNWSYPLNFADLASKGKIYMDSPLVIGTTNCRNVAAEWEAFITEPKALVRRFQSAVWVELNDDYKTPEGRFDFDKVNSEFRTELKKLVSCAQQGEPLSMDDVLSCIPWHVWRLHAHGFDRENVSQELVPGGLRAVVETAASEIQRRKLGNRQDIDDMKDLLGLIDSAIQVEVQSGVPGLETLLDPEQAPEAFADLWNSVREADTRSAAEKLAEDTVRDWEAARERLRKRNEERAAKQQVEDETLLHRMAMNAEEEYESLFDRLADMAIEWLDWLRRQHPIVQSVVRTLAICSMCYVLSQVYRIVSALVKGALNAVCCLVTTVLECFGLSQPKVELQSNVQEKPVKLNKKHIDIASFNFTGNLRMQVGVPPDESVMEHVYNATVKCYIDEAPVGQFIGLADDVYLFPAHFLPAIRRLPRDKILYFQSAKHGSVAEITVAAFLELRHVTLPGYDIAAVSFGGVFLKATRNILKYFLTQHEIKSLLRGSNHAVRLDVAKLEKDGKLSHRILTSLYCEYQERVTVPAEGLSLSGMVKYTAPTVVGDCGAPLSLSESRHFGGRCIIGIHSAGRDNIHGREGYATVVTQEVARELYKELHSYVDCGAEALDEVHTLPSGEDFIEMQTALRTAGIVGGSVELVGVLEKPVNMPTKTALNVSEFQRDKVFGECPTAPAVLKAKQVDGEWVEPMAKGIEAYQTPLKCKSSADMDMVVDLAMQKHWQVTERHPRTILSFEEAICPPEHWKLKPINRKTAAGYKYAEFVSPKTPGKTAFLGHEGEVDFSENNKPLQVVRQHVENLIYQAEKGVRLLHLCTDFLKDELRPLHKVQSVATRVISGTPFDYTIAVRMYFGAYVAAMFDTYVANGMAPGINHYKEWFRIVDFLKQVGDATFDGDFGRFDSSEMPWIHLPLLRYINKWYRHNNPEWTPQDDRVRYILWLELVHSRHITGTGTSLRYVVQWNKSLPSGHPLTTVVNSMYSLVTLTGCYVHATGDTMNMWNHARFCTFGDDNVNAVSEDVKDVFNQVTVAKDMAELFDLKYTAGDKSGQLVPFKTIEEVTFLKRSFLRDDDEEGLINRCVNIGWVAPLAKESYLYEPYWYKNRRDPVGDLETRIEHCLCEMSLHPQHVWDEYVPLLMEWCTRNNVSVKLTSRAAARQYVKTRFDVWF